MRGSVTWEALTGMRTSPLPTDKEKHSNEIWLDAIRGSLYGGAAGDALGYPIEFMDYEQIKGIYGKDGILSYQYDSSSGKALLCDVPEMGETRAPGMTCMSSIMGGRAGTVFEPINHSKGCGQDAVLEDIVLETMEAMGRMYAGRQHLQGLCVIVEKAIELSHNQEEDIRNFQTRSRPGVCGRRDTGNCNLLLPEISG